MQLVNFGKHFLANNDLSKVKGFCDLNITLLVKIVGVEIQSLN